MPTKFELMHHALNLAETAKDAMRSNSAGEPDDATWGIAVNVLKEAQQMLPNDVIVKNLALTSKLWVSLRSTMDAVANSLSAANTADARTSAASHNKRMFDGM